MADVQLSWDAVTQDDKGNALTPDSYRVYRYNGPGSEAFLVEVPAPGLTTTLVDVNPGEISYLVRARFNGVDGLPSNIVVTDTSGIAAAPGNLTAVVQN